MPINYLFPACIQVCIFASIAKWQSKYLVICLFQGPTIVDQVVNITPAEDYIYIPVIEQVYNWVTYVLVNEVTSSSSAPNAELEYSSPEVPLIANAIF